MEETKTHLKSFFIIILILILFLLLLILVPSKNTKTQQTSITPSIIPSPTTIIANNYISPTNTATKPQLSPTLLPVIANSGVLDQELTATEKKLAEQKQALRKKIPLVDKDFKVTFDYSQDKFIVALNSPKESTKKTFTQWLEKNYPSIPIDRFIIN